MSTTSDRLSGESKTNPRSAIARPGPRDAAAAYRRIAWLLIMLVLVPSGMMIVVGVILLVRGTPDWNLVLGILVLVFCGTLATGITLIWVFIAKEQNLSQLQTDFVSKISHELRTPLTSIRLFVDTLALKRATEPAQIDECLSLLAQETDRLTHRIDRLLEWGRMEAGRRVYDLRPEDLGEIAREALELFHAPPGELKLDVDLEEHTPHVLVDRAMFQMAVLNLLSNAYKYGGRPREIRVKVKASEDRAHVRLSVQDNGEGIPPSEHKQIFQKFYRRDDRLSRMTEGSGLGLAIVSHVVKGHRGKIEVESEVGSGAKFVITLRAAAGGR
jgi:two-component system phosphate regulon sensor histidine kinase PhoR